MIRLISPSLVLVAIFGFAVGYFGFKYYECRAAFAEYRTGVAQDAARASANTVKIVQALTARYEAALRRKHTADKQLDKEYNEAVNLIHHGGKANEAYRAWAASRLPDGVVERLRGLSKTRGED